VSTAGIEHSRYVPLVSIITPTYNHQSYIGACIESVLGQTFSEWEQIIIDDGSTDATLKIVDTYRDNRIRYFRQDNVGIGSLAVTYNRALSLSRGGLVAILEGDDIWNARKLELQVPVFRDEGVVLSYGRAGEVDEHGRIVGELETMLATTGLRRPSLEVLNNSPPGAILGTLVISNFIPSCTVMLRRRALVSIGGFRQQPYTPYVDYPTWLLMAFEGKFSRVDAVMGYWRTHQSQYTSSRTVELAESASHLIRDFYESLDEETRMSLRTDRKRLSHINRTREAWALFERGRRRLRSLDRLEARNDFAHAFRAQSPYVKMIAAAGWVSCSAHLDLERLLSMMKAILRFTNEHHQTH
jgi:glycosyltransferase involved in cell wall biosynthesis